MTKPPNNSFKQIFWMLVFIASLQFVAYSFMLSGTFKVLDDQTCIVNNPDIQSFKNIGKIFTSSFFVGDSYYRPMVSLSYMLEFRAFGLNPFFYNLDNLLIHILTTFVVFFLVLTIFKETSISFWTALLFGIHPVHWEAVANMSGRAILLCAFFTLSAFLFLLALKRQEALSSKGGARSSWKSYCLYFLSLLFFVFGLLSKESAVMLPVVICLYMAFRTESGNSVVRKTIPVLPFFLLTGIYLFVRHQLGITQLFLWRSVPEAMIGFMSFLRGLITFLRVLIFPTDLHFDRMQYVFTSFFEPQLIGTVLFFISLLAAMWRWKNAVPKAAWFFILWFFLELSPVSQILVTVGVCPGYISIAEHFLYVPSVGFFVVMAILGREFFRRCEKQAMAYSRGLAVVLIGYLAFLFLTNIQQNIYAASEGAMLRQALEFDPKNNRVRNVLALYYAQNRRFDLTEGEFRESLKNNPMDKTARIGFGKALTDQGRFWEGIVEYERIPAFIEEDPLLKRNLALTYGILMQSYHKILKEEPNNAQAQYSLGIMYSKQGQAEKAIEHFLQAVKLNSSDANAFFNLASSLEAVGRIQEAAGFYRRYLALAPQGDQLIHYAQEHLNLIEGNTHETLP